MAFLSVPNIRIKGISACVPSKVEENRDLPFYTPEEAEKVIETTGVERKHIVSDGITKIGNHTDPNLFLQTGRTRISIFCSRKGVTHRSCRIKDTCFDRLVNPSSVMKGTVYRPAGDTDCLCNHLHCHFHDLSSVTALSASYQKHQGQMFFLPDKNSAPPARSTAF